MASKPIRNHNLRTSNKLVSGSGTKLLRWQNYSIYTPKVYYLLLYSGILSMRQSRQL